MKKEADFGRECPTPIKKLMALLNEVPRTDEAVMSFLDLYHGGGEPGSLLVEVGYDSWMNILKRDYPNCAGFIGRDLLIDKDAAAVRIAYLCDDRRRLLAIIRIFNRPASANLARFCDVNFEVPITQFSVSLTGAILLRQSPTLSILMSEQRPYALLERLSVCPKCEDIRWLKKNARSDTCGKQPCRDRVAYVRKKSREGKTLTADEQRIFDLVGPGERYKK